MPYSLHHHATSKLRQKLKMLTKKDKTIDKNVWESKKYRVK